MTRHTLLASTGAALALIFSAAPVAAASAQTPSVAGLPYDARRGVFTFAAGLDASLPAVVQVTTLGQSRGPRSDGDPKPSQGGSGVIIDAANGIIVTNNHVIENGQKFTVDLSDGRLFDAVLIGADKATDIAVLKIEGAGLSQVQTVDSDTLRTGDLAFAVGYPLGLDQTLTMGVISGLNRSGMGDAIEDYIQTDAAVNSGNSGGPLLDSRGRLIGINTSILSGGMGGGNDGIAFAVPTRIMMFVVDQLRATGEVKRGQIGVALGSLTAERARELGLNLVRGAVVYDAAPGSSAEAAGLRPGDVITRIQNRPVANAGSVQATVGIARPGATLPVVYLRDGREATTSLTVQSSDLPAVRVGRSATMARGLTFRNAGEGAQITVVEAGSAAAAAGVQAGDVVVSAGGASVSDMTALATALQAAAGAAELTVMRDGERITIHLPG
ncbi:serine protease Do/serine protease DegQ [Brevundimonas bullata]|uniref:Serine protease Do/serine protease DegQ n=1 Tax=Brevundimonas bullata TaxID=13160 RepID=A0A7W7IMJ5_9CAUL|nr:trypsin-like peptidase domain-containing protein [Brevundimonas bullata]MBB4796873.1 serine protease Do/serine protease DegQ [Brevundimonas bullata]MBB6381832.1 serine protease Do/serine protease DegQ [Brevundimonas bullata]